MLRELPDSVTQAELEGAVRDLCADDTVDGLLVQLPLPLHIDEEAIIDVRCAVWPRCALGYIRQHMVGMMPHQLRLGTSSTNGFSSVNATDSLIKTAISTLARKS